MLYQLSLVQRLVLPGVAKKGEEDEIMSRSPSHDTASPNRTRKERAPCCLPLLLGGTCQDGMREIRVCKHTQQTDGRRIFEKEVARRNNKKRE